MPLGGQGIGQVRPQFARREIGQAPDLIEGLVSWPGRDYAIHARLVGGRRSGSAALLFLYGSRAFANALAQIGQFSPAHRAFTFHFHFLDSRRMDWKHALDTLAIANAADGEHGIQAVSTPPNHNTREYLDTFLVAFDDLGVDADGITHVEVNWILAVLLGFNFIE